MGTVTPRLSVFLESAPRGSLRVLCALSAAESLSDWLARKLVELVCPGQAQLRNLVSALHVAGFLVERNSEWHLSSAERDYLVEKLQEKPDLFSLCHGYLAEIASGLAAAEEVAEVPAYLLGPVGNAYHKTAISPSDGLPLYRQAYAGSLGERWLAARLATEQQKSGLVPANAIEPAFLRGMVLYREGRTKEAMHSLRPVAYSNEDRYEVAIAAHLFGRSLRRREPREAERLIRRSLAILESIGDRFGQAHVLHTLGQMLWNSSEREAEQLLRRSLNIGQDIGHKHHEAEVLHSLGQNLWRNDPLEAGELLRRSLAILEATGDQHGQAQVLHTLGHRLWEINREEAEKLLHRSIAILEAMNDKYGMAQVLHTLGQHLVAANHESASILLDQSLKIGEEIGNLRHQAIVLLTLAKMLWPVDPDKARILLRRSLFLEREGGNRIGEDIVLREMRVRGIDPTAG